MEFGDISASTIHKISVLMVEYDIFENTLLSLVAHFLVVPSGVIWYCAVNFPSNGQFLHLVTR